MRRQTNRLRYLSRLLAAFLSWSCGGGGADGGPSGPGTVTVSSVVVTPDSVDVRVGATTALVAAVRDAQGAALAGQTVVWRVADPVVATVSAAGVVSAVAVGRTQVTASAGGMTGTAVVRVVPAIDSLAGAPADLAAGRIPMRVAPADTTGYRTDNPRLPGVPVAVHTLTVLLSAAATVGEVNGLLTVLEARIVGGIPGSGAAPGGLLVLRLPTTTSAQLESARTLARQQPFVRVATADVRLTRFIAPRPNAGTPAGWTWSPLATGGNYGLELIRVPSMWNLNDLVRASGSTAVETGVLDVGFDQHEDLLYAVDRSLGVIDDHGTHVAGTVAALFDNGKGVDGVTPFARLVVGLSGGIASMATNLVALVGQSPQLRVINLSLGYNWWPNGQINTNDLLLGHAARDQATDDGLILHWALLSAQGQLGRLPAIFAAAGNDSDRINTPNREQEAKWASPFNAAALVHGNRAITVVEAVNQVTNWGWFSNRGGHVSAPGVDIVSTLDGNRYGPLSGTSMATPHVTGLASYVYAVAPDFPGVTTTSNPMQDLLLANALPTMSGPAPVIDAFDTVMDLDRVLGGDRVLRGLLDIDDGSPDGNLRVTAAGAQETGWDLDADGKLGDGAIDMSDFRRFRDALLWVEQAAGLALDGGAAHPKRDLNGDRRVDSDQQENFYPRMDFNGDGGIDRFKSRMRGALNGQNLTDLEVLASRFNDPHYSASELEGLLESGDISVQMAGCTTPAVVTALRLTARVSGATDIEQQRTVPKSEVHQILTLPVNLLGYTVDVEALDAQGGVVVMDQEEFAVDLAGDSHFTADCKEVRIEAVTLPDLHASATGDATFRVQSRTSSASPFTNEVGALVVATLSGGTVVPDSTATANDGTVTVRLTRTAATAPSVQVFARTTSGSQETRTFFLPGPLTATCGLGNGVVGTPYSGAVTATGGTGNYVWSVTGALPPGLALSGSGTVSGTPTMAGTYAFTVSVQSGSASATASCTVQITGGGLADPWIGSYLGTGTASGAAYGTYMSFVSFHSPSNTYTVTFGVYDLQTNATLFASFSCFAFGPPTRTQTTGSCQFGRSLTLTRSTTMVNGVEKRIITGSIANVDIDPSPSSSNQVTIAFTMTER